MQQSRRPGQESQMATNLHGFHCSGAAGMEAGCSDFFFYFFKRYSRYAQEKGLYPL